MARTAGSWASWSLLGALGLTAALVQPLGCGGDDASPLDEEQVRAALAQVGPAVIAPAMSDFADKAEALRDASQDHVDDLISGGDPDAHDRARQALAEAILAWQRLEVMQIGPLAAVGKPAGEGVRDEVYSWPTVNPCRVDQELATEGWTAPDFFATSLVNAYGLDAIAYQLHADLENRCPAQVDINADGTWDALDDAEIAVRRGRYAADMAARLAEQARAQADAWSEGGSAASALADAGGPDSPWTSPVDGLDSVYEALFYLEKITKDRKLGTPLGLKDCPNDLCPDAIEHPWTGLSVPAIEANLDGFEALYTGGDGPGLDDLLVDVGHADIDAKVRADLADARAALATITLPLDEALVDEKPQVEALHAALTSLSRDLKGDIATVLVLEIPSEAAGDAD